MSRHPLIIAALAACSVLPLAAQEKNFVEGFHGGLYGHYPLRSYTTYMMDLLDSNPEWRFCLEIEPETWDSVAVADPSGLARLKKALSGDRVEYTNPTYAQPYCYNITGESLIRQFEYGMKTLDRVFPGIRYDSYAVEEPCFTSTLPQILKGFGIRYASIKNPNTTWGGYAAAHGGELVEWIAPDGSSVKASPRHQIEELGDKVWETKANGVYPSYYEDAIKAGFRHPVGMCYQDAGWTNGLWLDSMKVDQRPDRYVTWREYFENVATDVEPEEYKFHQEDVCGGLVWGSQVLQRIAGEVRDAENGITGAEKMGAMAHVLNGYRYSQADVDEAWRCLLLSQHHDSWIVPYNNLKNKGTWADWICGTWTGTTDRVAARVTGQAEMSFLSRDRKDARQQLRVYNTSGVSRIEVVSVSADMIPAGASVKLTGSDGKDVDCWYGLVDGERKLVFEARVPAFGYSTYGISWEDGNRTACTSKKTRVIENSMYRITFSPKKGGTIKSIYNKIEGYEMTAKGDYAFGEMKGFFPDEGVWHSSADSRASVTTVEDNRFEKKVRICGTIASHPFTETLTLREGDPKIGLSLSIDWQGSPRIGTADQSAGDAYGTPERVCYDESGKLNIYFPTVCDGGRLFKSAPFDVCESRLESTRFTSWKEIKHNIVLDWVDLEGTDGKSIAILSDRTTAYVNGGDKPLGITVQYSGYGLWGRNYNITGPTAMDLAIMPHDGSWETVEQESIAWNEPLLCAPAPGAAAEDRSLLDLGDSGYQMTAAHIAEGGGILVRIYNATGDDAAHELILDSLFSSVSEVDLRGNPVSDIPVRSDGDSRTVSVSMPRFGFRTFILK